MKVISRKDEREWLTKLGPVKVCDTIREWVDEEGEVILRTIVRTEFSGDWGLDEVKARELWEWQCSGFQGPPPFWAA